MGYEAFSFKRIPFESVVIDRRDVEATLASFSSDLKLRAEQAITEFALSAWRNYDGVASSGYCAQRHYRGFFVRFEYLIESLRPARGRFKVLRLFLGIPPEPERSFPHILFVIRQGKRFFHDTVVTSFKAAASNERGATALVAILALGVWLSQLMVSAPDRPMALPTADAVPTPVEYANAQATSLASSTPVASVAKPHQARGEERSITSSREVRRGTALLEAKLRQDDISMGSGYVIRRVLVRGNTKIDSNYIRSVVDSLPSRNFSVERVRGDTVRIADLYKSFGMRAVVSSSVTSDPQGQVRVIFRVDERASQMDTNYRYDARPPVPVSAGPTI